MKLKGSHCLRENNAQTKPLNLSVFCASLRNPQCGRFVVWGKCVTALLENVSHAKAQRRKALPRFQGFLCAFAPSREKSLFGMTVAKCDRGFGRFWKGKLNMKTVVSFLLGAVVLFGAATLGLQSASANAKDKHDKNYWRHHHKHHRHYRHRKNHLSY
jgi:hypothetical protein